jgi:hypothetical protein
MRGMADGAAGDKLHMGEQTLEGDSRTCYGD